MKLPWWKWTIPILLFTFMATLIGCGEDANAQLFRRKPTVVVVTSPHGGGGSFDFQTYFKMRVINEILHNRTRIDNIEAQLLQSRFDALQTEIAENAEQIITQRMQSQAPVQTVPAVVYPQAPSAYAPVYRHRSVPQVKVQITSRAVVPRIVRRE